MAFVIRNLGVLDYTNGFTLWHYKATKETMETICAADYFLPAADMLSVGDMIMINALDGSGIRVVTATDETAVRLTTLI